jgi:hypothetical protein
VFSTTIEIVEKRLNGCLTMWKILWEGIFFIGIAEARVFFVGQAAWMRGWDEQGDVLKKAVCPV